MENEYGNVEFVKQKDGSLTVSFARRQEFQEPVFDRDSEKINSDHLTKEDVNGMTRMRNNNSPFGAEAFVLAPGRSAAKQVNLLVQASTEPLEQMARSMASILVPASQDVMPQEQMDLIYQDLVWTARHVLEKGGEKIKDGKQVKKEGMQIRWAVKKDDGGLKFQNQMEVCESLAYQQ